MSLKATTSRLRFSAKAAEGVVVAVTGCDRSSTTIRDLPSILASYAADCFRLMTTRVRSPA